MTLVAISARRGIASNRRPEFSRSTTRNVFTMKPRIVTAELNAYPMPSVTST